MAKTTDNKEAAASAQQAEAASRGNMDIYRKLHDVPKEARKPITDGRLKGKTDINPMWRIERLTEVFGPCGFGWTYELREERIQEVDEANAAAFVRIDLFIKDPATGEWSKPIPGTGGNVFKRRESSGKIYIDDDCFKKALSDAIGTAAKALGLGADVYYELGASKYTDTKGGTVVTAAGTATGTAGTGQGGGQTTRRPLNPQSTAWNKSIVTASTSPDSIAQLRARIEKKFTITDEDFLLLMKRAGRVPEDATEIPKE